MKEIDYIFKNLDEIEKTVVDQYTGLKKYKIYSLFKLIKKHLGYREEKPFIDVSEDGMSFRCQTCGTLMEGDVPYNEYEFCPVCGQRVAPEGRYIEIYLIKEDD